MVKHLHPQHVHDDGRSFVFICLYASDTIFRIYHLYPLPLSPSTNIDRRKNPNNDDEMAKKLSSAFLTSIFWGVESQIIDACNCKGKLITYVFSNLENPAMEKSFCFTEFVMILFCAVYCLPLPLCTSSYFPHLYIIAS